jgi:hypothetical protein
MASEVACPLYGKKDGFYNYLSVYFVNLNRKMKKKNKNANKEILNNKKQYTSQERGLIRLKGMALILTFFFSQIT